MELTAKNRLFLASTGNGTDRKPCICPGGMMNMIFLDAMRMCDTFWPEAHSNAQQMAKLASSVYLAGGFENYGVPFCMTVEAEGMGAIVDMGNHLCEPHVVHAALNSSMEFDQLKPLNMETGRTKVVLDAIRILSDKNDGIPVIGNLTGPISVGGTLLDMAILLREMRKNPQTVKCYLDKICDNLIAFANAQIAAGADAICISEPSGTGEILGPKYFEQYTVYCLNRVLDAITVKVKIVHICGNLKSVYHCISQLHCDVFSFDAMVPISEIKKHCGNKAVMGNISTFAMATMPPEKIATLVQNALKSEVDIVAPACGLAVSTPLYNVQAIVRTVREEGKACTR